VAAARGEDVVGGGDALHRVSLQDVEICSSTNPTACDCSLFPTAAAALAKAQMASPTNAIDGPPLSMAWSKYNASFLLYHLKIQSILPL
jgi:hypothetical protein